MRPQIGLVLGGGGSRGIAHIGVLEVLTREAIPIDLIVGTSMGGIVGTMYALGIETPSIADHLRKMQGNLLFSMNLFSARARQRKIRKWLIEMVEDKTFADLNIPLTLTAVDMIQGEEVAITEGELIPALLATSAMPAIFPPVNHSGMQLADGGVIDSLATHIAFEFGAEKVIAVDIYPALELECPWVDPFSAITGFELPFGLFSSSSPAKPPSMLAAIWRSRRILTWRLHEARLAAHPPDVLLRPSVEQYGSLEFKDIQGPLEAGIAEAERCLHALKALVTS